MAGLSTGAGAPVVKVYHEKSMILPDVSRVLACLYEKDVQFETVKDSYKDILRLQATRSVPVPFYDGPTFRQESRAICRYIAETYEQRGYPFLLGKDVLERASIEQWLRHEEHAFDPPSRALFCHLAFPLQDEDISDLDREKRKLEEVLEVYEQRLGESEFLAGNKFTLADLVHLPNTHHIVTSDKFAYLYDSRKNVQRWWNTISARDSWQQVVKDMQSVEEQYQMEELELEEEQFQQQQWHTEPPQPSGGRNIRIDSRKQTGPQSRTILVPPPRDGITSSSFFTVPQEHQPLPAETTSHGKTSPDQRKENNFFNTTEKTPSPSKQRTSATQKSPSSAQSTTSNFFTPATPPTTTKMFQRTDSDKSTSKDTSSPNRTSQGSSKEAPDRLHLSDFYQTSNHTEEAAIHTKPTSREASKTSDRVSQARQTSEAPNKPSPGSAKAPQEIAPDKTTEESFSTVQSTTSTFFTPATQEIAPDKTTQKSSRSVQSTTSTFFTPAIPPTTTKMPQRTDTGKSTSKDASSPTRPSEGLSKEAPDKLHLSDFYKARSHTDEAPTLTKPTPQEAPKTSDRIYTPHQTSEAVAPDKPSLASAKAPRRIDGPDFYETERKTTSVDPWADNQVPYTKPDDSQKPRSPYTRPAAQRAADTSGAKAGETPSDQRSAVQTPYAQQPYEQAKKAATDQRAAAAKDVQGETAPQARYRGAEDNTKEAREADQKKAASAPTRELPSGSQNTPQQSKAPPTDPKVSNLSPMQAEYEDAQGGNERFSTKRLRKMLEKSDEALKLQSTDLQVPPEKEETPSVYKKPPHVQDRKGQADNLSVDGRTDGTPSTGTRAPDTPTSAAERRAISALKGGMSPDGDGATEPRKSPSINEQQPAPPMPSQSPTSSVSRASASSNGAAQDDDLAQLSTIDQWRHTSTPVTEQGPPGAPSIDKLVKTGGVDRRAQPSPPKKTTTEQSDKSHMDERTPIMTPRQAPPSNTRRTSASTLPSQEPVSSLQQTTKPVKGLTPASYGITGEESANIAMTDESRTPPAPLQTPASDGRRVSTDLQGRILDARGENEAVKPVTDPRGIPTMPKKQELTPGVQRRTNTTSDQPSDKAPLLPSFADARNEKTGITEASQTTTTGPDEKPGRRAPKNSGDKLISSNNIGKQTTEAVYDRSSATSREMPPLVQENSMRQQQLQSENSGISPQDNRRQGSEAALPVSGTQQPKRRELLTNADQNSGRTPGQALQESEEQTSPDTQQVKYNRMNRESDGSRKPTQFDGNEGDVPKSQRGSSSTNP